MKRPSDELLHYLIDALDNDTPKENKNVAKHLFSALMWSLYPEWYSEKVKDKERVN